MDQSTQGFWVTIRAFSYFHTRGSLCALRPAVRNYTFTYERESTSGRGNRWRINERKASSFKVVICARRKSSDTGRRRSLSGGCFRLQAYKLAVYSNNFGGTPDLGDLRLEMVLLPGVIDEMVRNMSVKKKNHEDGGKEAAGEIMAKEAKRNKSMICLSGSVKTSKFDDMSSVCSKRGNKGINQDSLVVWEDYGCQEDMVLCGIFDGHGPWGHMISKQVRKSLPAELLSNWQQQNLSMEVDKNHLPFNIWKQSCLKAYAAIDEELKQHPRIDSFYSGTTALTVVKQGRHLVVANAGDSRAVLAVTSDDGCLKPVQLSVDFKPNLPEEAERITQSKGRVLCLKDEPGVYRVWTPNSGTPGLAISRAFGDYCTKQYGLISVPDVSHRIITNGDQFVIVATDGVWDVMSNQEAVQIVSSTPNREMSAKRVVDCAALAWKSKKRGIARDDISAICLFFHASPSQDR